ncbi:MAG: zinc metallopeptidase [Lachnospiraceae bacterium]|nr:zinc metallopeptidase [Lachnospiraceae bacterium]
MPLGYYGFYFDPTYMLVLIGTLICIWASAKVNNAMNKYHRVRTISGITGAEAASRILQYQGINDVTVECVSGGRGDHYDPSSKTVRLSQENYNSATVTAVSVAAHEVGHAMQHHEAYGFLNFRTMLVPFANIASNLGLPIILIGVLLSWNQVLIEVGIWAFSIGVLFQLVTLPVEFNASKRALEAVTSYGILTEEERAGSKKVLSAAAFTYVAAAAASILQLLRLMLLFGGRRRDD